MILLHRLHTQNFKQLANVTLCFPPQGTILIEGHNEAGKSSLFEAVYFALYGKPLISDRDFKTEYLRAYGADELCVELDFSIEGRRYSITRRLKGNQKAALTLQREDGTEETLNILTAVNRRLLEELRISPESLLNTCFIEQKRLERLEGLNPADRQETINELLNLRVLTSLKEEFRVSREEHSALQRLKGRVAVAQLDAALPTLEKEIDIARLCRLYSLLQANQARWQEWQREIEAAQQRQDEIQKQRDEIAEALNACNRLRGLVQAIETDLTLRARAWADANSALAQATLRTEQLQTLAESLPERSRQLNSWQTLADQLSALETLEQERVRLESDLKTKQEEIDAFDALQIEWDQGEEQYKVLLAEIQKQQEVYREAEERREARVTSRQRSERLNGILQQMAAYERAVQGVKEVETRLATARAASERLPAMKKRLTALEALEQRLRQRDDNARDRTRIQTDLDTLLQRQQEQAGHQERIGALTAELAALMRDIQEASEAEQQANAGLREAELRAALETWAEASARCAEFSPGLVAATDLPSRIRAAEAQRETADRTSRQVSRQPLQGYAVLTTGVVAGMVAFAMGQMLVGLVAAGLMVAVGAMLAIRGQRAVRIAQEALNAANVACATLEGERRTVEAQAQSNVAQTRMWAERESEAQAALMRLLASVPATPAEARSQIQRLTTVPFAEAQTAHRNALEALRTLETERELAKHKLENETRQAGQADPEAQAAQIGTLTEEVHRLTTALEAAEDLPTVAASLNVAPDRVEMLSALQSARTELAAAEAQHQAIAGLETESGHKTDVQTAELATAAALARELIVPGTGPDAWREAADAERAVLHTKQAMTPDATLHEAVRREQQALTALESKLAVLDTDQLRRQTELAAKPRSLRLEERQALAKILQKNAQEQEPLQGVRAPLERDGLPTTVHPLNVSLATIGQNLRRDTKEAGELPTAQEAQHSCQEAQETKCAEFTHAWQDILGSSAPKSPTEALDGLPALKETFSRQLVEQDEAKLKSDDAALHRKTSQLDEEIATRRYQQKEAEARQQALRQELGIGETDALDTLPSRFSELQRADEQDAEGWERTLNTSLERRVDNRSQRQG